ncbi:hypothetical protein SAMN04487983_105621 [Streptomyces sp. yr375]|uniref:hypothetical protein n=1 Tax=Streptomyces sp. yr375 TaxID=1761906 RepID=UPI0008BDDF1F|nr:hypothetical protein [Streptomyces sp. yr375]SES44778.1 hypothetical protein SAMN04487983_105621 [Streptomyces sp. yr375]
MSDERTGELADELADERRVDDDMSAELFTALDEFAAAHETPPRLTGAEIRGRAVRRGRRRTAARLATGTAALTLLTFTLTLGSATSPNAPASPASPPDGSQRQLPAATPPNASSLPTLSGAPSPGVAVPAPLRGTVDLRRRTLTVGDRVMPMASDFANSPTIVGPMTVYKKDDVKTLTLTDPTDGSLYTAEASFAVELRDARNAPVYVGIVRSDNVKDIGRYDVGSAWIGLDMTNAVWFYKAVPTGSVLSVAP